MKIKQKVKVSTLLLQRFKHFSNKLFLFMYVFEGDLCENIDVLLIVVVGGGILTRLIEVAVWNLNKGCCQ